MTIDPAYDAAAVARDHGISPKFVYQHALNGFAADMSDVVRLRVIGDPRVKRIERDTRVSAAETTDSWGLDRIDQRSATRDGQYTWARTGQGVTAYVVDTGIRYSHEDFEGRATFGHDIYGGDGSDCNGHGTHVAGVIGGRDFGVAKDVDLVSVRALDCDALGTMSGVVDALDWIVANAQGPSVVNLSMVGTISASLDDAIERLTDADIVVVVAAGNAGKDACDYSPSHVASALTVGATDNTDTKTSWSNDGACVDVFAPGKQIVSTSYASDTATATKTGTSMATPHVAGVAALVLEGDPGATPTEVADAIRSGASQGVVKGSSSTNNDLVYSRLGVRSFRLAPWRTNVLWSL